MNKTRDNHYVPQWYQKGFFSNGKDKLCYTGISPKKVIQLPNGKKKPIFTKRWNSPSQCFYQTDLYTTIFGNIINDEIEQQLFGEIDDKGSVAVRAFISDDSSQQHNSFQDFFIYLDAQKIRTPKGLDWIKHNYPELNQLDLMIEMQAIRNMHCTLWTEGVREIVSAENSSEKFIISDHPITIYNYACPPDSEHSIYPSEPDISFKATQTIFPLDKDHALILTNLEYAQAPEDCNPLESRTHAQKVRNSMTRTDAFIRTRKLSTDEVRKINYIIKARAKQYIAAGNEDSLYPEKHIHCSWDELKSVLLPPSDSLYQFGGEMFVGYDDGSSHYQDSFGRTKPHFEHLTKNVDEGSMRDNDFCGCGSGSTYKNCCKGLSDEKRRSWKIRSIRERNLDLYNAIYKILELDKGKSWEDIRKSLSDEQIKKIYRIYGILWPNETDIYQLLPKPDGKFRGLYSGFIDPRRIGAFALGLTPFFDELLIQHPFVNPNNVKPEFSPVESPGSYKIQALKDIVFLLTLEPFVVSGLINLIPDPCCFDSHLQRQSQAMAVQRKDRVSISEYDKKFIDYIGKESIFHTLVSMPDKMKEQQILKSNPDLSAEELKHVKEDLYSKAIKDPVAPLQTINLGNNSQLSMFSLAPNYEMSLFISQVTGATIITDSETRWLEFHQAQSLDVNQSPCIDNLRILALPEDIFETFSTSEFENLRLDFRELIFESISGSNNTYPLELSLIRKLKRSINITKGKSRRNININVLKPKNGLIDKNIQRLLIQSTSRTHLNSAVMVVYIEPTG